MSVPESEQAFEIEKALELEACSLFMKQDFDEIVDIRQRRLALKTAIEGINALQLDPRVEARYRELLTEMFNPIEIAYRRYEVQAFDHAPDLRATRLRLAREMAENPLRNPIDHLVQEFLMARALEMALPLAELRFKEASEDFRSIADIRARLARVDMFITDLQYLFEADPDEKAHYLQLLTAERLTLNNAVVRFDAHSFDAVSDLVVRLQQVDQALLNANALSIPLEEKTHYVAMLTQKRTATSMAVIQSETLVLSQLPSSYIQQRDILTERLRAVQAKFSANYTAERDIVMGALQAKMPTQTMIIQQTAERIASNDPSLDPETKRITRDEHSRASVLAIDTMGW